MCRQILNFHPKKIILFERSETSLYQINQEINNQIFQQTNIVPILGCASNFNLINKVINENKVSLIFHTAAYKHVPLLEENPLARYL